MLGRSEHTDAAALKQAVMGTVPLCPPGQAFRNHIELVMRINELAIRATDIADRLCGSIAEKGEGQANPLSSSAIERMEEMNKVGHSYIDKISLALSRIHNVIPE